MSESVARLGDPRNHLLWSILEGESRADVTALMGGNRRLSYSQVARVTRRGSAEIDERLPPGSRVLIAAHDQMVVGLAFLAALRSRCTPLLVDPQARTGIARLAARWKVAGALGERNLLPDTLPAIDAASILAWSDSAEEHAVELPAVRGEEPAFWTFTSGTTGEPRAVVHAHRGPIAAHRAFGEGTLGLGPGDRTISTAGLPFVYALGNALLFPLFAGGSAVLPRDLLLPTVLSEIARHEVTALVSGPWSLAALARLAGRSERGNALRRLALVLSAGEPLAEGVFRRWQEAFGQAPIDNLGCTEMFNSFLSQCPGGARPGSLGGPLPGFEVRVAGAAPTPGTRGALAVRGESRAVALSTDDDSDRVTPPDDEWCETGDEVEVGEDGRFVFLGRLDDRFKVRGQFVRPAEVERRLLGISGVQECLVGRGVDDHAVACAVVRVVIGKRANPDDVKLRIREELRAVLPALARVVRLEQVAELPRSPRGKLMRERRTAP